MTTEKEDCLEAKKSDLTKWLTCFENKNFYNNNLLLTMFWKDTKGVLDEKIRIKIIKHLRRLLKCVN